MSARDTGADGETQEGRQATSKRFAKAQGKLATCACPDWETISIPANGF